MDKTDKPDLRDISGTGTDQRARKGSTLISFDRLAEFERGEPARERRQLTRPSWLREPAWLDRACRNPRVILASEWVTGLCTAAIVVMCALLVQELMPGAPAGAEPKASASPSESRSASETPTRPSGVVPVEPKLPQPPPRTTLSPQRTRAKATSAPEPTRSREPSVAPSTPAPPTTEAPKPPDDKPTDIDPVPTDPGTTPPGNSESSPTTNP